MGYLIFYTGKEIGNREFRVTFMVDKAIKGSFLDFEVINDRICVLYIKSNFLNVSLIHIHAPTWGQNGFIRDELCQELEKVYDSVTRDITIIILGDLHAKVGKEMTLRGTTWLCSVHDVPSNDGCKLIDFAVSKNVVISSVCFPHKEIYKRTWASLDVIVFNQID
jgi:hypothetical protein